METSILAATPRLSRNSLEANVSPRYVHAGPFVEPHRTGRVLGVDSKTHRFQTLAGEVLEHVLEQRDRKAAPAIRGPDPQNVHPTQSRLTLRLPAESDRSHFVARLHEKPVGGLEVLTHVPVGPRLERDGRESPGVCKGVLLRLPRRPLVTFTEGTY